MQQFYQKVKLIFVPFVIIGVTTIVVYTLLHWLLFIKYSAFIVDDDIVAYWAAIIAPIISILIWLRPRLKLLDLKKNKNVKDPLGAYLFLAWILIAIPNIIAQSYLDTATGERSDLNYISQMIHQPATKYYTVKRFYINKNMVHPKTFFNVSGKYNSDFDMTIYAAVPVFDNVFPDTNMIAAIREHVDVRALVLINGRLSNMHYLKSLPADSIKAMRYVNPSFVMPKYGGAGRFGALMVMTRSYKAKSELPVMKISPVAWLTVKYSETISNNLTVKEKNYRYKAFANKCDTDFKRKHIDKFIYLERVPYGKDLKGYKEAIALRGDVTGNDPIVLSPVYKPFADRNGNKAGWLFGSLSIGAVIFLITLLFKPLQPGAPEIDIKVQSKKDMQSAFLFVKGLFIPSKSHFATQIIIQLNVLVFVIMVCSGLGFLSFNTGDLLRWGGNFRPLTFSNDYWRLLTNIFIHGGVMHILLNMYGLFFVGMFLEPVIGSKRYVIIYIFTGIVASLTSAWWHPATVSVGASGAIFGMYGVFLALLTANIFPEQTKKSFLISTSFFVGINLLLGMNSGFDNAAHIGGLVSGFMCGYILYLFLRNKPRKNKHSDIDDHQSIIDELNANASGSHTDNS